MSRLSGALQIRRSSDITGRAQQSEEMAISCSDTILRDLNYRLTGLLILQTLYATLLEETGRLRARLLRQEAECTILKDELLEVSKTDKSSVCAKEATHSGAVDDNDSSLFSPFCRAIQMRLTKCEEMIAGIEGMTAKGLIQVYCLHCNYVK